MANGDVIFIFMKLLTLKSTADNAVNTCPTYRDGGVIISNLEKTQTDLSDVIDKLKELNPEEFKIACKALGVDYVVEDEEDESCRCRGRCK